MTARARGGRRSPPDKRLIGRTAVGRILHKCKREVRRLEERGIIKPALIESDGTKWFSAAAIRALATRLLKAAARGDEESDTAPAPTDRDSCRMCGAPHDDESPYEGYYPEHEHRDSRAVSERTATRAPPRAATKTSSSTPPRPPRPVDPTLLAAAEDPPAPRKVRKQYPAEWATKDLDAVEPAPAPPPPSRATKPRKQYPAEWATEELPPASEP